MFVGILIVIICKKKLFVSDLGCQCCCFSAPPILLFACVDLSLNRQSRNATADTNKEIVQS